MTISYTASAIFQRNLEDVWAIFSQMSCVMECITGETYRIQKSPQGVMRPCFVSGGLLGRQSQSLHAFDEKPLQWVKFQFIRLERFYNLKPYISWKFSLDFDENDDGARVTFCVNAEPTGNFQSIFRTKSELKKQLKSMNKMFKTVQQFFDGDLSHPFPRKKSVQVNDAVRHQMLRVEKSSYGHGLTRRLVDLAFNGLESEVANIRPHHIANRWQKPVQHITELLMSAAKEGLLEYRWHMSCQACGHMQGSIPSLDRVPKSCQCEACGKDFIRDFSKNVEMVFRPHRAHRTASEGYFCYVNPSRRRRTLAYMHLEPNERLEMNIPWPQTEALNVNIEQTGEDIMFYERQPRPICLRATETGRFVESVPSADQKANMVIVNERDVPLTIAVRMPYAPQMRYTGMEAITSHAFRELCGHDVLERSDEIPLSNVTVMFTDLKDSTRMYEDVGDLRAYQMVRDHFDMMSRIVRANGGALVKTIGDAIMAVFMHPKDAVMAGLSIQNECYQFNQRYDNRKAIIKMGIHSGPCVSVLMNGRIDFFGQMINTAARLQANSVGQDMVISLPVVADADVARMIRPYGAKAEKVMVKGLDEPVQFLRLQFDDEPFEEELQEGDELDNVIPFSAS